MQCHVCNSSEFLLFDGVYFCSECNSQIEASRKEQAEQEGGFSKKSLLKSTAKEKRTNGSKKIKLYAPWTTTEGFNLIICKQVSALISLGASEKLKNVVLHIWSKYLQKCETAFRTDYNSKETIPRLSVYARKRDIKVLYGDKIASGAKKQPKENLSKGKKETEKEDTYISDELMSDANETSDAKTTDSDTETDGASDDSSTNMGDELFKFSSHAQKLRKTLGKKKLKKGPDIVRRCVHNMTLCKILSFCYLGLLYTEDQLLLCDLLRLAKEGKVPYMDATQNFPPSMPMLSQDQSYFTTVTVPTSRQVSMMSAKLFEFLKLPSFKHPPLMPMVFRFVNDLNLPDSIMPIVNILYNKMKRKNTIWYKTRSFKESLMNPIPLYDVEAMALIVVSLKLLLVLDGKFEVEHSKIMKKINVLLKGKKMFVWDEWKKQMKLKEFLFMKNGFASADFSRLDTLSVDEIIRKYPITRLKEFGDYTNRVKHRDSKHSVARKEIKTLVDNITNQGDVFALDRTTSFPLKYELSRFVEEGDTWQMFQETRKRDMTFLNKDFSSDLLFYRRTHEISEKSEELIYLLLSTLYESSEVLTLCKLSSSCQNMLKTSSKYWHKNISRDEFCEHRQLWNEKLPGSFAWLLKLLCKYMQVACEDLYLEIIAVEKELFLNGQYIK